MIKVVILDLDGTVYRGKQILPYVRETVEKLIAQGKKVVYLTNASMRTREEIKEKLIQMGLYSTKQQNVYSSGYATVKYIKSKYQNSVVYAITQGGLIQELKDQRITVVTNADEPVDLVVIGLDKNLTYEKLNNAFRYIKKGAKFIASNADKQYPVENDNSPGAGSIVAALEYSTGVKPFIVGKPNTYMLELIAEDLKCSKKDMVLVGDNLLTDVQCANNFGCQSVFVLGGVSKKSDIKKLGIKPTKIIKNLSELTFD